VAHGDIDYVVCEENIATIAADSLPQIDIHLPIGFTQFYSWGLNKKSPALLDTINVWLDSYMKSREYRALLKKYF
jgi:ABC-type amino acid transport substrate-binding protein